MDRRRDRENVQKVTWAAILHCIEKLAHQSNRGATCLCLESLSNTQPCCSGRDTENRVREAAHYAELEL